MLDLPVSSDFFYLAIVFKGLAFDHIWKEKHKSICTSNLFAWPTVFNQVTVTAVVGCITRLSRVNWTWCMSLQDLMLSVAVISTWVKRGDGVTA